MPQKGWLFYGWFSDVQGLLWALRKSKKATNDLGCLRLGYGWVEQNTVSEKCFFVALVGFMWLAAVCETKNNPWLKCFMVPVGHITFWP